MNTAQPSNGIPAWLDSWLFGWTMIGPITAFAQLAQASRQEVQLSSVTGAFQVNFPSGMQVNDTVTFVDTGNAIATNNVTLSSVVAGLRLQNPNTLVIGPPGSYPFGSNELNGSSLTFQLIQDPNIGLYLKGNSSGNPVVNRTTFLTFDISAGPASFTLPTTGLSNGLQFDCTYSGEGTANTLTVIGPALSGTGTGIDSSTYNAMVSEWVGTGTGRAVFTWNPLLGDGGGLWVQT